MNRIMRLAVVALTLAGLAAGTLAAQGMARLDFTLLDPQEGKPWPNIIVIIKSEQGQEQQQVSDEKGRVSFAGLRSGAYTLTFKILQKGQTEPTVFWESSVRLSTGQEERLTMDFKKEYEKQKGAAEERKKQEEAAGRFEGMKVRFDQGRAALDQARQISAEASKAPADQKSALNQKAAELRQTAITEFQAAQAAADAKEENLHLIMANLALAYESNGNNAEAEAAFAKALELKPTQTNYVVGLGNSQAKQGKVAEAMASCDKVSALDPPNSATCYRNIGIILYNANKLKEAIEPFKKATSLDPNNPDQWYLLGASLVAAMDSKQQGDKIQYIVAPGTAEAYQKYLELAPQGRFAGEAQGALAMLESLGAGTSTRMKVKKGKS